MQTARINRLRIASWLLAALFLLAQAGAQAHEYDHALHKHEVPCAQHFFAGSLDAGAAAAIPPPAVPASAATFDLSPAFDLPSRTTAAYYSRAPPHLV